MFKGNKNLAVGVFVATALLGVLGLVVWLTGRQASEPMKRYSLLFEQDVSGLALGGSVYYMGINVGTVENMVLVVGDKVLVRVDIDVFGNTPIDSGTSGSLSAQGITGVTIINLSGERGQTDDLVLTPGFEYPLITVRQTGLLALSADAPELMKKMLGLLDQANALLGEKNRASIGQTLGHLESLAAALAQNKDVIAKLPGELNSTIGDVRSSVNELKQMVVDAGPDMTAAMDNVNQATERLASLTARIDDWLAVNEAEMQDFIANGLGQAPELISDARSMMRQLEKVLRKLQDDPAQLIHQSAEETLEVKP